MANLEDLLNDLANLDAQHDFDGIRRIREELIQAFPESDEAAEAQYKIGLDFLFRQRDMQLATAAFAAAVKKKHPYWSAAARTSLALCYYHQKKVQKALFELRRVAFVTPPNVHSVTALGFLETVLLEEGNTEEASRSRKERINQLEKLVETDSSKGESGAERGHFLLQLGIAYRDAGEEMKAKEVLSEAKEMGPEQLGAELYRSVADALR